MTPNSQGKFPGILAGMIAGAREVLEDVRLHIARIVNSQRRGG
jgi:hypothetical protein